MAIGISKHHNMGFVYHPLFREGVVLAAIILLAVFCIDKSRQNQRTRNALYNCIYVLYAASVVKALQLIDAIRGPWHLLVNQLVGLVLVAVAVFVYWRWFTRQKDIPYNTIFWNLGWIILIFVIAFELCFLVLAFTRLS